MKKYLTVAAVLGAIAFVSVSYIAQANDHAAETTTTTIEQTTTATTDAATAVATECEASVAASFEGKMPTDEEKAAALKACVDAKAAEATTEATTEEKAGE